MFTTAIRWNTYFLGGEGGWGAFPAGGDLHGYFLYLPVCADGALFSANPAVLVRTLVRPGLKCGICEPARVVSPRSENPDLGHPVS